MWEFFHILFIIFGANIAAGFSESLILFLLKKEWGADNMYTRIYWVLFPIFSLFIIGWHISNGTLGEYGGDTVDGCTSRFC